MKDTDKPGTVRHAKPNTVCTNTSRKLKSLQLVLYECIREKIMPKIICK